MEQRSMLVVMDVHKESIDISVAEDGRQGEMRHHGVIAGDLEALAKVVRAVDRQSGNLRWKASLGSRPVGGPLPLPSTILMPLVSSEIIGFDRDTGKPTVTVKAAGEMGPQPFFRPGARPTAVRLITVSREGQLQGFAQRFEPVPGPLDVLPGTAAVP